MKEWGCLIHEDLIGPWNFHRGEIDEWMRLYRWEAIEVQPRACRSYSDLEGGETSEDIESFGGQRKIYIGSEIDNDVEFEPLGLISDEAIIKRNLWG